MINDLNLKATVELTTSFHDTDAMGVVWHGNYLKFFEKAREKLFSNINYGYKEMIESGYYWPVVDTRLKFIKPVIVEQKLKITATLEEYEHRVKINYLIVDANTDKKMTTGYTIQVAVSAETQEMSFMTPDIFLSRLGKV